jgi:endonuclease YncB( thermonuclease family)
MRALILAAGLVLATPALADPCEAPLPKPGTPFSGTVRSVGDGDGYCVSDSSDPATWIEVRTADFYAEELTKPGGPEAKAALRKLIFGKRVECVAGPKSWDRTIAVCTLSGTSVGDLMRRAGVQEGGRGK